MTALFPLGQITATPGALAALEHAHQQTGELLKRHVSGDWGEVSPGDARENEFSVPRELRIISCYRLRNGARVWVITEADRSSTTLLLPDEY